MDDGAARRHDRRTERQVGNDSQIGRRSWRSCRSGRSASRQLSRDGAEADRVRAAYASTSTPTSAPRFSTKPKTKVVLEMSEPPGYTGPPGKCFWRGSGRRDYLSVGLPPRQQLVCNGNRRNVVDPRAWLVDVLRRFADHPLTLTCRQHGTQSARSRALASSARHRPNLVPRHPAPCVCVNA